MLKDFVSLGTGEIVDLNAIVAARYQPPSSNSPAMCSVRMRGNAMDVLSTHGDNAESLWKELKARENRSNRLRYWLAIAGILLFIVLI